MAKVNKTKVAVGVGLGLAAAAAAGAGYYFYGSKSAGANRKKAAKWATDLEAKVKQNAKKLQKLDKKAYAAIVDEATKAYLSVKSIDQNDLKSAALELKQNWNNVEAELTRTFKSGKSSAKKAVNRTAKKVVTTAKKVAGTKAPAKKAVVAKKKA